jgi:hypothetical protein
MENGMPDDASLIERLKELQASGMSASAAAGALLHPTPTPGAGRMLAFAEADEAPLAGQVAPADLSTALAAVYASGLTAAELASIIHTQFPQLPAYGVAEAVLAGLPNTSAADMLSALTACGFQLADAQGAVNILYPTQVAIQSTQPWQETGVTLTGTQATTIACAGTWTADPATGMYGAEGNPLYIAKPGYTLPGSPEGAMIGQVGANPPFLVGSSAAAPTGQAGMLSLCINDDLDHRYGAGLADNSGSITATITTQASS